MSVHMRKRHTSTVLKEPMVILFSERGEAFKLPERIIQDLDKYLVTKKNQVAAIKKKIEDVWGCDPDDVFAEINKKYTKAGALLKGVRARECLTQKEFAGAIGVTQGDLSKMENGKRPIGKAIAKRIDKKFGANYRYFL